MTSRRKFLCLGCGEDTGEMKEFYFLKTPVWLSVVGSLHGMYCIGCFEDRLGRQLGPTDFDNVYINSPKHSSKSQRLIERLGLNSS